MLGPYLEDIDNRRKRFIVYSQDDQSDLVDRLGVRNVTVEHRKLPRSGPKPFVTIHDSDGFAGALTLADLKELLAPPVVRPGERTGLTGGYRALLDVLAEAVFTSLDRRQLLATSREFEDRALRVGQGTLRVTFQSLSRFERQTAVYRQLGTETDLDIHVYGETDWTPPTIPNVTYHSDTAGMLTPFWCLAFDGGMDPNQACALVAREDDDSYTGFWSYDPDLVGDILATVRGAT